MPARRQPAAAVAHGHSAVLGAVEAAKGAVQAGLRGAWAGVVDRKGFRPAVGAETVTGHGGQSVASKGCVPYFIVRAGTGTTSGSYRHKMGDLVMNEPTSAIGAPQTPPTNMADVFAGPCPSAESGNGTNLPPVVRVRRGICRDMAADTAPNSCAPPSAAAGKTVMTSMTSILVFIALLAIVGFGAWYMMSSGSGRAPSAGFGSMEVGGGAGSCGVPPVRPPTPLS